MVPASPRYGRTNESARTNDDSQEPSMQEHLMRDHSPKGPSICLLENRLDLVSLLAAVDRCRRQTGSHDRPLAPAKPDLIRPSSWGRTLKADHQRSITS
ncbi:hypothetical protein N7539_001832 [Penicillium diatomitis]|uniref:Uncharacterized protein n=1 Tax=Penicillium diatomitis TaxID=2819901 RepID=A0A9W9XHH3_9EURO|nr:uncharacterized protein N7539_001832 [Penicillium diatomitis]KAJ5493086.1 hypothetical protein N7539_001832 [Penicillium diatomitis]